MSVSELSPIKTAPEEQLTLEPGDLESGPTSLEVDEATVAVEGAARVVGRVEHSEEPEDFDSKLSAFILEKSSVKHGEGKIKPPIARTRSEQKKLDKAIAEADKVIFKRSQKEFADLIFAGNAVYSKSRVRTIQGDAPTNTRQKRNELHDKALRDYEAAELKYQSGEISEESFKGSKKLFQDRSREARVTVVWQSARAQNKARRSLGRAERKIKAKYETPIRNETSPETSQSEHTRTRPATELVSSEPSVSELTNVVSEELVSERVLTPLEQLQKLRAEGKLPEPTPKTGDRPDNQPKATPESTSPPETTENDVLNIAQGILAQVEQAKAREPNLNKDDLVLELLEKALVNPEGTPDSDISDKGVQILEAIQKLEAEAKATAEPESAEQKEVASASTELLDESSIERMAELAYIGAQDKVHLQIDAEDRQRRADGKPKLTKEEKAEYWKNELDIREQLLGNLSPENKTLVDKQISELIKTDKAAYRAGEEKLRDKRRRERREQQAAERKAQPASTSQRGNETVQQRARREREEKAKQKIADGQRTFSHPDIPS